MNVIRYHWHLSPPHPFSFRQITEKKTGYPCPDMHEAVHLGVYLAGRDMYGRIGETEFVFRVGEAWLSAPWEPHSFYSVENCTFELFTFDANAMAQLFPVGKERFQKMLLTAPGFRMGLLKKAPEFSGLAEKFSSPAALWLAFGARFAQWIANCTDEKLPEPCWSDRLAPALEALRSGRRIPLPLSDAAGLCNLSVCRFSSLFKAAFGTSFGAYELQYRLQRAAAELTGGERSIKEIAGEYGFFDKCHFSRVFRKHFGMTPGGFRRSGGDAQ